MEIAKKNIFARFYNWFLTVDMYKNYKEDTDKNFYLMFLYKCIAISIALFLSFITPVLNFLPVLVCAIAIITERSFNRLYFFVFITPFWFVFDWILLVYGLIFASWGLKHIRDLCNKQIKLNWKVLLVALIPILYVALPIGVQRWDYVAFMATMCFVLYFVFTYRENCSFKRFTISATIAILASVILGFIGLIFKELYDFPVAIEITSKLFRFSACNMDCNFLGAYVIAIFASLTFLYLRKEINILYLILVPIFTMIMILTGSKLAFLMYSCVVVYLLISILFLKDSAKNKLISLSIIISSIALVCLIFKDNLLMLFGRFNVEQLSFSVETPAAPPSNELAPDSSMNMPTETSPNVLPFITTILTSKIGLKLSSITSYRLDLWLLYFNELLLAPLSLIFGKGEGAQKLSIRNSLNQVLKDTHNSMVDLIYYLGVVFLIFVVVVFVLYLRYRKKQNLKFNKLSIMVLIASFVVCCSISAFLSYLFVFLILNSTLCMFEIKKGDNNEDPSDK